MLSNTKRGEARIKDRESEIANGIEKICLRVYETGREVIGKKIASLKMYVANRAMRRKEL